MDKTLSCQPGRKMALPSGISRCARNDRLVGLCHSERSEESLWTKPCRASQGGKWHCHQGFLAALEMTDWLDFVILSEAKNLYGQNPVVPARAENGIAIRDFSLRSK